MGIDTVLQNVLNALNGIHILAMDAGKMENIKNNIQAVIAAVENAKSKEEQAHED